MSSENTALLERGDAVNQVLVLITLAGYFYGAGRLLRWGCERADEEIPSWWTVVCMLLWPRFVGRLSMLVVPDAWGWPEKWIAAGLWLLTAFVVLRWYFKIRFMDSLLIWGLMIVLAMVTMFEAAPLLTESK